MYSQIFRSVRAQCSLENHRLIHSTTNLLRKKNHYEVLEIKSNATQNDVKQAYYKLSKMYHPDRNKDNPEAVEKFREISDSYEVLGNYNLRKLYDKGILHTAGGHYAQAAAREEAEDDPQTRFYKMRMKRTETPQAPGEQPVYDFDEWTKQHYGANFDKRMKARMRRQYEIDKENHRVNSLKIDKFIYAILFTLGLTFIFLPESFDIPKPIKKQADPTTE